MALRRCSLPLVPTAMATCRPLHQRRASMGNDPLRRFVVLVAPFQFESGRMRHRAPSNTRVQRMARILERPVRSNVDAEEHVRTALVLLHYWPSAFAPLVAELQRSKPFKRRRTIVLRRDRLARRRQRRQRQEGAVDAEIDEQLWAMLQSDEELPRGCEGDAALARQALAPAQGKGS